MENIHRLLQLSPYRCYHRREDFHNAWWSKSRSSIDGTNTKSHAADRCSGCRWAKKLLLVIKQLDRAYWNQPPFPLIYKNLGLLCDLLWSDPDKDITGWSENDRGVSFTFGPDVVSRFLQKHDMDLICRAHQVSRYFFSLLSKVSSSSHRDCKRLVFQADR